MVIKKGNDLILDLAVDIADISMIKVYTTDINKCIEKTDISSTKLYISADELANLNSGVISYDVYRNVAELKFDDGTYNNIFTVYTDYYYLDTDENGAQHKKAETVEEYVDKKIDGFEQEIEDKTKEIADSVDAKIKVETDRATEKENSLQTEVNTKQDTLVSGVNIKTINDQSLLGEGNIVVKPNLDDYAKLNGDNVFTGNNSFSNAVTVNYTKISADGVTLLSGTKYSANEIKLVGSNSNLTLNGQSDTFRFAFNGSTSVEIYKDYLQTNAIKGTNDVDYLIFDCAKSELSLNATRFTPIAIKYQNKTIPLADIVVTSDLEEVENVAATAIKTLASASGLIDSDDKIAYVAPTTSGEFSNTTSTMDMLNHIDAVWNNMEKKFTSTTSTDTAITLKPNANVDITCNADTTINLEAPTDTSVVNLYSCTITMEDTVYSVTFPEDINFGDELSFEANTFTEINIRYANGKYYGVAHNWSK